MPIPSRCSPIAPLLLMLALLVPVARAHAQPADATDDLSAQATDPTAALMSFQVADWYTASTHGSDATANQVVFRAAIPFAMFGTQNIFRVTVPTITSAPSASAGLGDTQVFNLTVLGAPWGRWGVGMAGSMPTGGETRGADRWTLGPAAGFVNSSHERYSFGLFVQSFFSLGGDATRPDVGIALVYDTTRSRWSSLGLGLNYGQIVQFWGHTWRPNIELDHDFQDRPGNPKTVLRLGISLLLPAK